ncbi:MAG: ABC-F family ATP-binding cassette domain-containing protein [Pseudomonadota bacterium]
MLTIHDLGFNMAGRPLFEGASVRLPQKARVGLFGRNGTGKTTLFRLIRGDLAPDAGRIEIPQRARLGGVAQEVPGDDRSLMDTVLAADEERARLMAEAETAHDPTRIAEIQLRLTEIGAHSAEARAAAILSGLGFDPAAQARATREYSGGWRMRVALAAVLFSAPDLLLLDEPTNYLDLEGTLWLEHYLARYPHGLMLISHDRGLLNRACTHILHLSQRRLTLYTGNFETFDRTRREKAALAAAQAKKQAARRAHLQAFVDRFRAKATKARQAQSRIKMLERMQPITIEGETAVAPIRFADPEELPPPIMQVERCDLGYGGAPVLRRLGFRLDQEDRIALLGANGQGKSTLAKLIAGRIPPMEGERRVSGKLRIGYFAQHQAEELVLTETPLDHIRRARPEETPQRLRATLANAGISAEIADTPVKALSGGQKARLMLCLSALDAPHLMILDEPTNHLDMESREALVEALNAYRGAVILITHDPFLVDLVADRLWLVDGGRVVPFEGDMADYRAYVLAPAERQHAERRGAQNGGAQKGSAEHAGTERSSERRNRAVTRAELQPLKKALSEAEARLEKITDLMARVDEKLADPKLYDGPADKIAALNEKRAELEAAQSRAEAAWLEAGEKLEAAGG